MRILIISQWFEPEPTFKGLIFARRLQALGHEVEVVTGFPNYPGGNVYSGYRIRPWLREIMDGIPVLRVALYPSHDRSPKRRIANYLSFAFSASVGVCCVRRPDVAYVYHPPATVGLPAMVLKALRGVPFVYDIQDLWPDTLRATGMVSHRGVLAMVGRFMGCVYRSAARIAVLSDGFADVIGKEVPPAKVEVIRNWANEDKIVLPPMNHEADNKRFTIVFAGAMGNAQALPTVLGAAHRLADRPEIRFLLVGDGTDRDRLQQQARDENLNNVEFLPWRPMSEIGSVLAAADALLVHLKDDPLFRITIPSKTQTYLMAGRPILMGVEGDAARLIEEAGAGICFRSGDPNALADAARAMVGMDPRERARLGTRGARFYQENLAVDIGVKRFETLLIRAARERPRADLVRSFVERVAASLALLVLSPGLLTIGWTAHRRLGGPVLFRQVHPGRHGTPFQMVKFRTMTAAVDMPGRPVGNAKQLTPFGARLRALFIDEMPGLWNVVCGEMSLVGPRPLLPRYTSHFTAEELTRLDVKPGITGWAQIHGRNLDSWTDCLALDVWYVNHRSLRLDLAILARSFNSALRRDGVVPGPASLMADVDVKRTRP